MNGLRTGMRSAYPIGCAPDLCLESGRLCLFSRTGRSCPPHGSLWGILDKVAEGSVCLESSTLDMRSFRLWHFVDGSYRFCRLATPAELRDYVANLICYECECHAGRAAVRALTMVASHGR